METTSQISIQFCNGQTLTLDCDDVRISPKGSLRVYNHCGVMVQYPSRGSQRFIAYEITPA